MALTLPSSNGASYLVRPESIQLNTRFNGGLTQTTSTLTPTRLKNIQEAFLEQSHLPPKPFQHEHMAGFVTPNVNISLFVKPNNLSLNPQALLDKSQLVEFNYNSSTNSNSNDSFAVSDDYSSEASSSAVENSSYSFSNLIIDMNSSSSSSKSTSNNKKSQMAPANSKSRKSKSAAASTSQQKPRKSTGGGRKPTRNDKLSPEEAQKREKRRERNKLAAARCRKRRLDQTNTLVDKTGDLESEHEQLVERLQGLLDQMSTFKRLIEMHERHQCKQQHVRLVQDLFSTIDFESLHEAMKPLAEEESYSDLEGDTPVPTPMPQIKTEFVPSVVPSAGTSSATSVIVTSSNAMPNVINFAPLANPHLLTSAIPEPTNGILTAAQKRKRPNSLPVSSSYKSESSSTLQTPSSGINFEGLCPMEAFPGLTPSITPSLMTPSTMAAFMKTLSSPTEESDQNKKKLLII